MLPYTQIRVRERKSRMIGIGTEKTALFRGLPWAGILAISMFAAALYAAIRVAGWHFGLPISLAGSSLSKVAQEFNAVGFVAPGMLLAYQALRSRLKMQDSAKKGERFAMWLWLLSGLAFAAMGAFALDTHLGVDEGNNQRHAVAWYLWWSSAALGCISAAFGSEGRLRVFAIFAFVEILLGVWYLPSVIPAGAAQVFAVLAWMVWPFSRVGVPQKEKRANSAI